MSTPQPKSILITGCSTGFGRITALNMAVNQLPGLEEEAISNFRAIILLNEIGSMPSLASSDTQTETFLAVFRDWRRSNDHANS